MKKFLIILLFLTTWSNSPVHADDHQINLSIQIDDDTPHYPNHGKTVIRLLFPVLTLNTLLI